MRSSHICYSKPDCRACPFPLCTPCESFSFVSAADALKQLFMTTAVAAPLTTQPVHTERPHARTIRSRKRHILCSTASGPHSVLPLLPLAHQTRLSGLNHSSMSRLCTQLACPLFTAARPELPPATHPCAHALQLAAALYNNLRIQLLLHHALADTLAFAFAGPSGAPWHAVATLS